MVWTINYLTIISINKLEPASSEGDHLLCKIFVFIRPGFETRCRPSLFQAQILIHKKCLTPRLWKMSEILQPPKKLDEFGKTVIERECCQIKLFLYDVGDVIHKFKCVFSSQYIYYLQCDALLSKVYVFIFLFNDPTNWKWFQGRLGDVDYFGSSKNIFQRTDCWARPFC